jgi:hypothetical protein
MLGIIWTMVSMMTGLGVGEHHTLLPLRLISSTSVRNALRSRCHDAFTASSLPAMRRFFRSLNRAGSGSWGFPLKLGKTEEISPASFVSVDAARLRELAVMPLISVRLNCPSGSDDRQVGQAISMLDGPLAPSPRRGWTSRQSLASQTWRSGIIPCPANRRPGRQLSVHRAVDIAKYLDTPPTRRAGHSPSPVQ